KYSRPRSTESSRPSRARIWLPGSQTAPPEYADVPPKRSVFSTTQVVSPREVAAAAPNRAATPEPTTITSYSPSNFMLSCVIAHPLPRRYPPAVRAVVAGTAHCPSMNLTLVKWGGVPPTVDDFSGRMGDNSGNTQVV